jgi:TPR repeat protein
MGWRPLSAVTTRPTLRLLGPLADQGNARAQYNLGAMYTKGLGVPQDYAEALKWYRQAANQGDAAAQAALGAGYATGQGLPQDYVQAHKWFNLAASTGADRPVAAEALAARYAVAAKMTPAQIAEAQKLAREWNRK